MDCTLELWPKLTPSSPSFLLARLFYQNNKRKTRTYHHFGSLSSRDDKCPKITLSLLSCLLSLSLDSYFLTKYHWHRGYSFWVICTQGIIIYVFLFSSFMSYILHLFLLCACIYICVYLAHPCRWPQKPGEVVTLCAVDHRWLWAACVDTGNWTWLLRKSKEHSP